MRAFIFLFAICLWTLAFADDALDSAVSITEKECRKLMRLHDMQGAEYVPGVDAHGRSVKSADLNDNRMTIPKEIVFNLGIDLAEKYQLGDGFYGKADFGEVKVKGRHVYWNGKKLGANGDQAALEACRAQYGDK